VCAALYKSYLECAARLVRRHYGEITSFDGDRIMAIYMGDGMETAAGMTALKLNAAVRHVIRPTFAKQFRLPLLRIRHAVGIDSSPIFAAKIGVRAAADIVWVGRAANYAAKLSAVRSAPMAVYATARAYRKMDRRVKVRLNENLWTVYAWEKLTVYRSTATWPL
jgi:class 3 adenylate cyclase